LQCRRIAGEIIDPLAAQIGVFLLAHEPADIVGLAIERDAGLRLDAAQYRRAGDQIVEADGRGVGRQAESAAQQAVAEDNFSGMVAAIHAGFVRGGVEKPVAAVARDLVAREQVLVHADKVRVVPEPGQITRVTSASKHSRSSDWSTNPGDN